MTELVADSLGRISGEFTIPSGIPAGVKLVEFEGTGTRAAATFVGRGILRTEDLRVIDRIVVRPPPPQPRPEVDPLAQTFIVPQAGLEQNQTRQVAAIDLWFTAVGTSNLLVQIRETQLGIPTSGVIAESLLTPSQINLNAWTRFRFTPVTLMPNQEYAIVVMCNDAVAEVATGGIGEFDAQAQAWVTQQPYQIGVLLSSSNARTWTPHQTKDLTFRLITCDYAVETNEIEEGETRKAVDLPDIEVVDADHLLVLAAIVRPSVDTDVVFEVTANGITYHVAENQPWTLPARFTGTVTWKMILTGTFTASPIVQRDLALVSGTRLTESNYLTRRISRYDGVTATLYYDAFLPIGSSVAVRMEDDENDWDVMPADEGGPMPLGDGWFEYKHTHSFESNWQLASAELILTGHARALPLVRGIRLAIT